MLVFNLLFGRRTLVGFLFLAGNVLIRIMAIHFVQQYMRELETAGLTVTVNGILPTHIQPGNEGGFNPYFPGQHQNMYAPPPAYEDVTKTKNGPE